MAINIDVKEEKFSVDIRDVDVYVIEVVDLSTQGSITVTDSAQESDDTNIQTVVTTNNITLSEDANVTVEISSPENNQIVTQEISQPNIIEITDNIVINDAVVSSATNRAARSLTAWSADGADIFYNTGNVGIGTSQTNHKLDVSGSVKATSFKGIFEGALSSSAQIATDISNSISTHPSIVKLEYSSSTNDNLIRSNLSRILKNQDSASSISIRLEAVEAGSTSKTLISGSAQIATEISGAFQPVSESLSSRLTLVEAGSTSKTLISGSIQIASEISGAFNNASQSIQSRLNVIELELGNTLISSSAQIATAVSGAFNNASESIQTRLNVIELNYISSSGEIKSEISGAFNNASESIQSRFNTIESQINQNVNTDSSVTFTSISSSRITASRLLINDDTRLFGSLVFNGLELFEDQITVRSGSTVFGSGSMPSEATHQFTGSILTTGSIIVSKGTIIAPTFTGIFVGALSSSAQIAAEISGAFSVVSESLSDRLTIAELELNNTLISGSAQIATEISGAFGNISESLSSRISSVEAGSTSKTLISGSAQIATEISGAFNNASESIQSRLNTIESELSNTLISGSAQIATEISGAFINVSESLSSRISANEIITSKTLVSSSAQIATDISGAFSDVSSSFSTRVTSLQTDSGSFSSRISANEIITSKTLVSSSAQIAAEISGAFSNVSQSISSRLTIAETELNNTLISSSAQIAAEISGAFNNVPHSNELGNKVVVYDTVQKKFFYTGSYPNAGGGSSTSVQYQTGSTAPLVDLTQLVINDYSNDVSVTTNGGILTLTFGSNVDPYFYEFIDETFDTDRFTNIIDDYQLKSSYNLYNNTFIFGQISASTNGSVYVGVTSFADGENITINDTYPSYQSGSHTFKAKIRYADQFGNLADMESVLPLELNKLDPTDPTVTQLTYVLEHNAYDADQLEIEEGEEGIISWVTTPGIDNAGLGWLSSIPHFNNFSDSVTVNATGNPTTGLIQQFWNSGTRNNEYLTYTGSVSLTWERVRSLRYISTMISSYSLEEIFELDNWSTGVIEYGVNEISEIESRTIAFNPASTGEYLYIIYDADLGNVISIKNVDSTFEEISGFNVTTVGNPPKYKVWRSVTPKNVPLRYKLEF